MGKIGQRLQIDIGFGDVVVPSPISISFPTLLEMEALEVMAYSIESVVAEKFEAILSDYTKITETYLINPTYKI